jgi:hypothetical protein
MYARLVLARAATVAIRYTAIRRQFGDKDAPIYVHGDVLETPTLDYTMVKPSFLFSDIIGAIPTFASCRPVFCASFHWN